MVWQTTVRDETESSRSKIQLYAIYKSCLRKTGLKGWQLKGGIWVWKDSNLLFLQDCFGTIHFHEIKKINFIFSLIYFGWAGSSLLCWAFLQFHANFRIQLVNLHKNKPAGILLRELRFHWQINLREQVSFRYYFPVHGVIHLFIYVSLFCLFVCLQLRCFNFF